MLRKLVFLCLLLLFCSKLSSKVKVNEYDFVETYMQYAPAVFALSGGVLGAHCEHDFKHRVFNVAFTYLAQTALVYPLKWTIDEVRPDGSAHNSFPSGHTAAVFAGAELIRMEYGWGWGALFYANAAFVGSMRVVHKRHWWWDAAVGAVLGIGSAHLGKLAADGLYIRLSPNSITLTYNF